ncbi:MAG: hypothetical protein LQ342_004800 [Letrouitia transgressa]|nr:MAG: hypothetical protein LQ342_004800 [Letrouitia transgressa]
MNGIHRDGYWNLTRLVTQTKTLRKKYQGRRASTINQDDILDHDKIHGSEEVATVPQLQDQAGTDPIVEVSDIEGLDFLVAVASSAGQQFTRSDDQNGADPGRTLKTKHRMLAAKS